MNGRSQCLSNNIFISLHVLLLSGIPHDSPRLEATTSPLSLSTRPDCRPLHRTLKSSESELEHDRDAQVRFNKLVKKAKLLSQEGKVQEALELNKKALQIHHHEKLARRIAKMEVRFKKLTPVYGTAHWLDIGPDYKIINYWNIHTMFQCLAEPPCTSSAPGMHQKYAGCWKNSCYICWAVSLQGCIRSVLMLAKHICYTCWGVNMCGFIRSVLMLAKHVCYIYVGMSAYMRECIRSVLMLEKHNCYI